jgi:hypothetical protein
MELDADQPRVIGEVDHLGQKAAQQRAGEREAV